MEMTKDEWNSDSLPTFHVSHTRAGMTAYKKTPAGRTVEVADEIILPVDGFGIVEVDLDQPGTTTKPLKMVQLVMCQDFRGTRCPPVKQWSNGVSRSSTTKIKLFWSSRGRSCLFLSSAIARNCFPQQV